MSVSDIEVESWWASMPFSCCSSLNGRLVASTLCFPVGLLLRSSGPDGFFRSFSSRVSIV